MNDLMIALWSYSPVMYKLLNDIFTVTVTEVLPKEKKQKEEKTAQLGQCTVDLLPLVKGTTEIIIHRLLCVLYIQCILIQMSEHAAAK